MPLYTLIIHFANGSKDEKPFGQYQDVRNYYRRSISYTGDKVRRVEVQDHYGHLRTIWDSTWNDESKAKGLMS